MKIGTNIEHDITYVFCLIDDFMNDYEENIESTLLESDKSKVGPKSILSVSEIMTILVLFQFLCIRNFKYFYKGIIQVFLNKYFPKLPSYNRFVEITQKALIPLAFFTALNSGKKTGIYYIDSTKLPACHDKRAKRNKVFAKLADYGKSSMGWFFGLKLHVIVNNNGELMAFKITPGNIDDRKAVKTLSKSLKGLLFGDKGYIGKKLSEQLLEEGIKLITKVRKNMKKPILKQTENDLLNQRGIIETVFDYLKNKFIIWHTRHRSVVNAMVHLIAALASYTIEPMKITAIKKLRDNSNKNELVSLC